MTEATICTTLAALSHPLDLEQLDVGVVPDGRVRVTEVEDTPHVSPEPEGGSRIRLVLPDEDRMRHRQEAHKRSVLQEP